MNLRPAGATSDTHTHSCSLLIQLYKTEWDKESMRIEKATQIPRDKLQWDDLSKHALEQSSEIQIQETRGRGGHSISYKAWGHRERPWAKLEGMREKRWVGCGEKWKTVWGRGNMKLKYILEEGIHLQASSSQRCSQESMLTFIGAVIPQQGSNRAWPKVCPPPLNKRISEINLDISVLLITSSLYVSTSVWEMKFFTGQGRMNHTN